MIEANRADRARLADARDAALLAAKNEQARAVAAAEADRDEHLRQINEVYARKKVDAQTTMAREMAQAVLAHDKRQAELPELYAATLRKLEAGHNAGKAAILARHGAARSALADRWHEGIAGARAALDAVTAEVDAIGPPWDDPAWTGRPLPSAIPRVLRFGEARVDLNNLPSGISADPTLNEGVPPTWTFPALAPFPSSGNLLVEAPAEGRSAALAKVQGAMARLLTSLPPGLVRFTIVDPVGIGRGFGAFMRLADHDEALVSGQVWTDARQIDERLAELAAHMEKVTQKYLRDEYASIDEYNAVAGEVAEPYRVLVVNDFPAGFDERSAARLASIAAAGPPCGVLALVARDLDRPLPQGFEARDLRANALALGWDGSNLTWADPDLGRLPMTFEGPPPPEVAPRLIARVGEAARLAKRVEVPFEFIAPGPDDLWSKDSRGGIDVPLGKSGATKRQNVARGPRSTSWSPAGPARGSRRSCMP